MYHGGGYCLGGLENEAVVCRGFAERGGVAVNVDYRLAPEYKFPKGLEDAYDALKWVRLSDQSYHLPFADINFQLK